MSEICSGVLRKMRVDYRDPVSYQLPVGNVMYPLGPQLGQPLEIQYSGRIFCTECGRATKKSFSQGHCFPCFRTLASCDLCMVRPETCHYRHGTCRNPVWADGYCMQDHYVYLANSSGLKVGITRGNQVPTRWIDQGATQAIPLFKVKSRYHSGLVEAALKTWVSDRTDWRKMLKGNAETVDMKAAMDHLLQQAEPDLNHLESKHPGLRLRPLNESAVEIKYPVARFPDKVTSLSFDKTPAISGTLDGIKGQYLILDTGVLNIRKFAGYEVTVNPPRTMGRPG